MEDSDRSFLRRCHRPRGRFLTQVICFYSLQGETLGERHCEFAHASIAGQTKRRCNGVCAVAGHGCITGLFLKDHLQTKLDNAGVARTYHLTEMNRIEQEERADLVKVGVIQHVRGLGAELNIHALIYPSVLEQ